MNPTTATDEALVLAFREKSVTALEEFYDRHHGIAIAVAYRVLNDRIMAEDVIQEAFLAVWRQADRFSPDLGSARTWFLSVVRHRAIDVTRGRAFAKERFSLEEINLEPRYPDAWQEVSLRLDRERIREALRELPEEQREVVTLAYFGGYTHQEISDKTGAPLGTVKGRMRLAMRKLQGTLMDLEEGDSD